MSSLSNILLKIFKVTRYENSTINYINVALIASHSEYEWAIIEFET